MRSHLLPSDEGIKKDSMTESRAKFRLIKMHIFKFQGWLSTGTTCYDCSVFFLTWDLSYQIGCTFLKRYALGELEDVNKFMNYLMKWCVLYYARNDSMIITYDLKT